MFERTALGFRRGLTVAKLRELLGELDDDCVVEGNAVGNLIVRRGDWPIGYVDFGRAEEVVLPYETPARVEATATDPFEAI